MGHLTFGIQNFAIICHDRGTTVTEREIDQLLVAKVQQGDRGAFNELVVKYQRRLFRVICRIIPDPGDAEDVMQETFIRAFRALPSFRGEAGFYTWLFRIGVNSAKNFAIMRQRKAGVSAQLGSDEDDTADPALNVTDHRSPMSELENKQTIAALNAALDAMPVHLSSALMLCEIDGYSYKEIAVIMDCPMGTVRSRIFRARELIAAKLAPLLETESYRAARNTPFFDLDQMRTHARACVPEGLREARCAPDPELAA